jgi:circadian clock protein KaiB
MIAETHISVIKENRIVLRLFVAGDAPHSRIAKENLQRFRERAADCEFEVEVVNVLENPQIMLDLGIYLTPALQVIEPKPGGLIYGNLSDDRTLRGYLLLK